MKKKAILLAAIIIPACFYLNVWQAFRYRIVENEIVSLEQEQRDWLEKNKKMIIGIEVLGAPSRIDGLAVEMEELIKPEVPRRVRVTVDGGGDG